MFVYSSLTYHATNDAVDHCQTSSPDACLFLQIPAPLSDPNTSSYRRLQTTHDQTSHTCRYLESKLALLVRITSSAEELQSLQGSQLLFSNRLAVVLYPKVLRHSSVVVVPGDIPMHVPCNRCALCELQADAFKTRVEAACMPMPTTGWLFRSGMTETLIKPIPKVMNINDFMSL